MISVLQTSHFDDQYFYCFGRKRIMLNWITSSPEHLVVFFDDVVDDMALKAPSLDETEVTMDESSCSSSEDGLFGSSVSIDSNELTGEIKEVKRVSFDTLIQVREYSITVGDHPKTKDACPLALDWAHTEVKTVDFVAHETLKAELRIDRRSFRKLTLRERRQRIADVLGVTKKEIRDLEFARTMEGIANSAQILIEDLTVLPPSAWF